MTSRLTIAALAALSFACTKPKQDAEPTPPEHGDHHGHHDHQQGDAMNDHGYKGHRFDDPEQWMAQFESPERTAWQKPDAVVSSLALAPDAAIADLGAGTGYFAVRFAAAAPEGKVYAVDIEPNMVAWLATRAEREGLANLSAVLAEPADPRLPASVDVVFMCNVFHHLAEPQAYFEAVAGKLEPEGRVVIVDFRKDNPDDAPGPPAHMRMESAEVVKIMEAAGYELRREDRELLDYQYLLEFVRKG